MTILRFGPCFYDKTDAWPFVSMTRQMHGPCFYDKTEDGPCFCDKTEVWPLFI